MSSQTYSSGPGQATRIDRGSLGERFRAVRSQSLKLIESLEVEDCNLQAADFVSPIKWHLAHTAWFFEKLVLEAHKKNYAVFDPHYHKLFNSYYEGLGELYPRPQRHLLSRPSLSQVLAYRHSIDSEIQELIERSPLPQMDQAFGLIEIGCHHEAQHQELILSDTKYNFSLQSLQPSFHTPPLTALVEETLPLRFLTFHEELSEIGATKEFFAYDNETPRHKKWIPSFELANRCVTNEEFIAFIEDGGYDRPEFWLSDAFFWRQKESRTLPLYWWKEGSDYFSYDLSGPRKLQGNEPVAHVNYYEAQAYAAWKKLRLPTEFEWEFANQKLATKNQSGNFLESGHWRALPAKENDGAELINSRGNLWEWTSSDYAPYPGFRTFEGHLSEYNGKFMCNQRVLRGGSCLTPEFSYRETYRNFFYAEQAWCFSGIRLAKDLDQ